MALAIRGVRWDEDYEFAQAMTGLVPYPSGHPLPIYARGAYNLQFYSAALALLADRRPILLCGLRNLFFIWSTALPPYLLATVATGRPLWGHAAAAFFLAGAHLAFDGAYPLFLWPGMFSNGHIGIAYALIVVALMAMGRTRSVSLLVGLMPSIHLGQMAPLLAMLPLFALALWRAEGWAPLRRGVPYLAAGLGWCFAFWLVQRHFALPLPESGPYAGAFDARAIWEGRVAHHDMHRAIPVGNSHILVAGTLLLALLGLMAAALSRLPGAAWLWLGGYAAAVVGIVYSIMALQIAMGVEIPYVFLVWLPYRLVNHLPAILLALSLAVVFPWAQAEDGNERRWPALVAVILAALVTRSWWSVAMPGDLYDRYFQEGEWALFALWGMAVGALVCRVVPSKPRAVGVACGTAVVTSIVALAAVHQFGACCVALGLAVGVGAVRISPAYWPSARVTRGVVGVVVVFLIASTLRSEYRHREHLPVGVFEGDVARLLEERGDGDAMIIGPPYQVLLQAQTGHPVMVDMATGFHGSYVPSLGPSIQQIYSRIYGIYFNLGDAPPGPAPGWEALWAQRTREEWVALAAEFDAPYLIVPNRLHVEAPVLLSGATNSLYRIASSGDEFR